MSYGSVDGLEALAQAAHVEDSLEINRLKRVQNDNQSGVCDECDEPIPAGRLAVVPNAKYCVRCQAAHDRSGGTRLTFSNPYVP